MTVPAGSVQVDQAARTTCREWWLWNMLFLNNMQNFKDEQSSYCMPQSWSISVEMQFYVVTPALLWALVRVTRVGLTSHARCEGGQSSRVGAGAGAGFADADADADADATDATFLPTPALIAPLLPGPVILVLQLRPRGWLVLPLLLGGSLALRRYYYDHYPFLFGNYANDKLYTRWQPYFAAWWARASGTIPPAARARALVACAGCFGATAIASVALLALALLAYIGNGNVPLTAPLYNYSAANAAGTGFAIVGEQPLVRDCCGLPLILTAAATCSVCSRLAARPSSVSRPQLSMMLALSGRALRTLAALLRWRGLVPIARLSYSAYLLQFLVIAPSVSLFEPSVADSSATSLRKILGLTVLSLAVTFAFAFFLFISIERPIMALRAPLEARLLPATCRPSGTKRGSGGARSAGSDDRAGSSEQRTSLLPERAPV